MSSSYVNNNNQSLQNHQLHLVSSAMTPPPPPPPHQDLSFHHWANDTNINTNIINQHQDLQYKIISSTPSPSSTIQDHHHRATTNFFSQIYPTINISSPSSSSSTTTFDMNLQALDLFHYSTRSLMQDQLDHLSSSSRRNGGSSLLSYNALHHDNHQHYMQRPFTSTNVSILI